MPRHRSYNTSTRKAALDYLVSEGCTTKQAAAEFKIPNRTLKEWLRRAGLRCKVVRTYRCIWTKTPASETRFSGA